jgi:hypothetical protein
MDDLKKWIGAHSICMVGFFIVDPIKFNLILPGSNTIREHCILALGIRQTIC